MAAKGQKRGGPEEKEQRLARLYSQLEIAGEDGEYEKGLKIAEKVLALAPEDGDALHCKLVCLVQCSKFVEALKLIDSPASRAARQSGAFHFEKAYCLYRLERYEESKKALQALPSEEERVRELSAQIAYRLEDYERASGMYSSLVKQCSDDFDSERQANYAACLALERCSTESRVESIREDSMELCFNKACCYLATGKGRQAEEVLRKSEELCRNGLLEDDYTEEEIESELSVVRVQLGCALQMQDKAKEALSTYSAALKLKLGDTSHGIIASNNVLVLNKDRDVFDSKKKVKVLANEGSSKKLTRNQKMVILFNRALFALHTNQLEQCRQLVNSMKSTFPDSEQTILAEIGLLNRERKTGQAAELVTSYLQMHPNATPLLWVTLAQLYNLQGSSTKVCHALQSIPAVSSHIGIVCVLAALQSSSGDTDAASDSLDKAVSYWSQATKSPTVVNLLRSLMLFSAHHKLSHEQPQSAAAVLEQVHKDYPTDLKVLARLITAYSKFDSKKAEEASQSLPVFSGGREVNVDLLEQMPSFRHSHRQLQKPKGTEKLGGGTGGEEKDTAKGKKRKKKKCKPKLKKEINPEEKPDPERWLPLRERSYYRKGRKRGFASLRGTQGSSYATSSLTAMLDASKPKTATKDPASKSNFRVFPRPV